MLNRSYFYGLHADLLKIIRNSTMDKKEKNYRVKKANEKLKLMLKTEKIDNHYYSLAHELKSYELLKNFGQPEITCDSRNRKGPDIRLNTYHIECVCCSPGKAISELEKYRLNEYRRSVVFDYNKKMEIILPRITSALGEKRDKFEKYIKDRNNKEK